METRNVAASHADRQCTEKHHTLIHMAKKPNKTQKIGNTEEEAFAIAVSQTSCSTYCNDETKRVKYCHPSSATPAARMERDLSRIHRDLRAEHDDIWYCISFLFSHACIAADRLRQQRELSSGAVRRYCVIFTRG